MKSQVCSLSDLDGLEVLRARSSNHRFPVHCHSTFVIELVERGADWCCLNDLTAAAGDVMVHAPFTAHTGGTVSDTDLEYFAIYPSRRVCADVADVDLLAISGGTFVCNDRDVKRRMQELSGCADRERFTSQFEKIFKRLLRQLVICSGQKPRMGGADPVSKIERAQEFLDDNCRQEISVSGLAEKFGMSQFHFIRKFKKMVGITPRQYLISRRVALGKEIIANGGSIVGAAIECGFSDQSHFTRCFKRVTGYSPGIFASSFE